MKDMKLIIAVLLFRTVMVLLESKLRNKRGDY